MEGKENTVDGRKYFVIKPPQKNVADLAGVKPVADHQSDVHPIEPLRPADHEWLIVLGFNDTSTLVGHFVSSLREEIVGDEREG